MGINIGKVGDPLLYNNVVNTQSFLGPRKSYWIYEKPCIGKRKIR